jgi:hypothetical protein
MRKVTLFAIASSCLMTAILPSVAAADTDRDFQLCTATGSRSGPSEIECVDRAGAVTQVVSTGGSGVVSGGNGGGLTRRGDRVLAINAASGDATLFRVREGRLERPELLTSGGTPVSGALGRGAYVLTTTEIVHFAGDGLTADSRQPLLLADGSAAQVVVTEDYAYVAEKNGSLEAFRLGDDGSLVGEARAVTGVTPGVIVGIAVQGNVVVAPIAHLASNPGQSEIDIVRGLGVVEYQATSQVAACWADSDDRRACITNPGSHTISCGRVSAYGLHDFTEVAATDAGESQFDIAVHDSVVGVLVKSQAGIFSLHSYELGGGNALSSISETPVGAAANGAVVLSALHR